MSISDWFKREDRSSIKSKDKRAVPEGIWSQCASCKSTIYQKELFATDFVCPNCSHHYQLSAPQRIDLLIDEDSFSETAKDLSSKDPLKFEAKKKYKESLDKAKKLTGIKDAIITGKGLLNKRPVAIGAMDFRFIGGSMGSVVGEKIVRLIDLAIAEDLPVLIATASGGARMQEGVFSLMQMAKTTAAINRLQKRGLPYICIFTNPTTGGVTASFATLADIIIAEPKALIGFTGPRVIEQTIKQKLPKDFQSSEMMLEHGQIDMIVEREFLKSTIDQVLDFLSPAEVANEKIRS